MPNINISLNDKEYSQLLSKKLAESKRKGKDLSWKEFLIIAMDQVKG